MSSGGKRLATVSVLHLFIRIYTNDELRGRGPEDSYMINRDLTLRLLQVIKEYKPQFTAMRYSFRVHRIYKATVDSGEFARLVATLGCKPIKALPAVYTKAELFIGVKEIKEFIEVALQEQRSLTAGGGPERDDWADDEDDPFRAQAMQEMTFARADEDKGMGDEGLDEPWDPRKGMEAMMAKRDRLTARRAGKRRVPPPPSARRGEEPAPRRCPTDELERLADDIDDDFCERAHKEGTSDSNLEGGNIADDLMEKAWATNQLSSI